MTIPTTATVTVNVDGRRIEAPAGATLAAAMIDAGVTVFGTAPAGRVRGPLCGMGVCHECRVTVDGHAHRRACMIVVADGMIVTTSST
jgi:sarcosine oxidase subunit alpha